MRAATTACLLAVVAGQAIYDFSSSPVVELTDQNFDELVIQDTTAVWIVEFYADWCGPCKQLAPVLEELALKADSKVQFYKVDVDQSRELAAARGVKSMPTIQFFKNGKQFGPGFVGGVSGRMVLGVQTYYEGCQVTLLPDAEEPAEPFTKWVAHCFANAT